MCGRTRTLVKNVGRAMNARWDAEANADLPWLEQATVGTAVSAAAHGTPMFDHYVQLVLRSVPVDHMCRVTNSAPLLRIISYHLIETSQVTPRNSRHAVDGHPVEGPI